MKSDLFSKFHGLVQPNLGGIGSTAGAGVATPNRYSTVKFHSSSKLEIFTKKYSKNREIDVSLFMTHVSLTIFSH